MDRSIPHIMLSASRLEMASSHACHFETDVDGAQSKYRGSRSSLSTHHAHHWYRQYTDIPIGGGPRRTCALLSSLFSLLSSLFSHISSSHHFTRGYLTNSLTLEQSRTLYNINVPAGSVSRAEHESMSVELLNRRAIEPLNR
jgi:hypothetical protein